jgi:predicted ATPase
MLRGDVDTADTASAEARDFSSTQGFPEFVAMAVFVQGWCTAERGDVEAGVALMEDGFGTWCATGFSCWQALFAAILAPRLIQLGRMQDARAMLERYIRHVDETGENQHRAPLLLARAILHVATGNGSAARDDIKTARAVAQAQGARLWLNWIDIRFPA